MTAQQMLARAAELERMGLRATAAVFRLAAATSQGQPDGT